MNEHILTRGRSRGKNMEGDVEEEKGRREYANGKKEKLQLQESSLHFINILGLTSDNIK